GRLVDTDAALLGERVALGRVVADADDQFGVPVIVQIGAPDSVAPSQMVVDDVSLPKLVAIKRRRVDHHLVSVPRLDGRNEGPAPLELVYLDLTCSSAAFGVRLIPLTN